MKCQLRRLSVLMVGLVLLVAVIGCESNGDGGGFEGDTGNPSTAATNTASQALRVVLEVLFGVTLEPQSQESFGGMTNAFDMEAITNQQVEVTVECSDRGEVTFFGDGTATSAYFTLAGAMEFDNCDGIDGSLDVDSEGPISGNVIDARAVFNGVLTAEACPVTFDQFTTDFTFTTAGVITSTIIGNGTISATCGGETAVCVLDNVDLEDTQAFEASCALS